MPRPRKARAVAPKNQHPEPGIRWLEVRACWQVQITVHGQRVSQTFVALTEARDWKRKAQAAPLEQAVAPVMTVGAWIKRYLADLEDDSKRDTLNGLAPRTISGYKEKLNLYAVPHLGALPITSLEPLLIRDWVKKIQGLHTTNAAWEAHRRLKGCMAAAVRMQVIPRSPCEGFNPPKGERRADSKLTPRSRWTNEEAGRVLAALDADTHSPIRQLLKIWLATGLRKQEILGLRWQDVNLESKCVSVRHTCTTVDGKQQLRAKTKTGRERPVTFDAYALEAFAAQLEHVTDLRGARGDWVEHDLVFPSERGGPFGMTTFKKWYARLCKTAKVPQIRPYDLRSTHGSALYFNTDMDEKTAAERMGHSVRTYLETYVRPLEAEHRTAAINTRDLFSLQTKRKQNLETVSTANEAK